MELKILSIDIGIINLGYVFANLLFEEDAEYNNYFTGDKKPINVIQCGRVDITIMKHNKVEFCNCKLHHDLCVPDYIDHFIQENENIFNLADIILLERQPPVGIMNVQDLIFTKFRNKVNLISPNAVHKYFNMSKSYEIRKYESELISKKYLSTFNEFNNNKRRHDISDAMLMLIYYHKIYNNKYIKKNNKVLDFEQFRFVNLI
jgi:hypothetical protein